MYHSFFIHSSVYGDLGCFHVLAVVNSAAVNIGVHVSFSVLVSSDYTHRSGIAGSSVQFSSVQSLSCVQLFAIPWTPALQASLAITNSRNVLKFVSIESVMPSNHLILCHPLLLSPSIFPSMRVFSNESVLCIRWPKDWHFSFSTSSSNEYLGLISFRMDCLDLLAI